MNKKLSKESSFSGLKQDSTPNLSEFYPFPDSHILDMPEENKEDQPKNTLNYTLSMQVEGKYSVIDQVGSGGMKNILRVNDRDTSRKIAMAVIKDDNQTDNTLNRFVHEARIAANLQHPNIIPIYDIGVDNNNSPFFTMKLIAGKSLSNILEQLSKNNLEYIEKYSLLHLLQIFQKVCDAIAYAHSKDIIHLDLKPENIQVGEFGEVLVLDWGLAKQIQKSEDKRQTTEDKRQTTEDKRQTAEDKSLRTDNKKQKAETKIEFTMDGVVKGSVGYMAPEQAAGLNNKKDFRTDIFSLGAILYSILTLKRPIDADNIDTAIMQTVEGQFLPPSLRAKKRMIPATLEAITLKAMTLVPEERYQSVSKLEKDIDAYLCGFITSVEEASFLKLFVLFIKRHKAISAVISACFILVILLTSFFMISLKIERNRAVLAKDEALKAQFAEATQRKVVEDKRKKEQIDYQIRQVVEHARLRLNEFYDELARKISNERLEEIYNELANLTDELQKMAIKHPDYPIVSYVRGELNFLWHHDLEAIEDFNQSLSEIDKFRANKDRRKLDELIKKYPFVHLASLGRARAILRKYCTQLLFSHIFTDSSTIDYAIKAQKQREIVKKDLKLAGEGSIPPMQGELANMWLDYSSGNRKTFGNVKRKASKLIKLGGRNEEAYFFNGLFSSYNYKVAIKFYKQSLDRYYTQPQVWFNLALLHCYDLKHEKSHKALDEAFRLQPDFTEAVVLRAKNYNMEKKPKKALDFLAKIPNVEKKPLFLYWRGVSKFNLGKYDKALVDLNLAMKIKPTYYRPLKYRSEIFYKRNMIIEAINDLETFAEHEPELGLHALAKSVKIKNEIGKVEEAFNQVNNLIKRHKKFSFFYAIRGKIFEQKNDPKKAVKDYKNALRYGLDRETHIKIAERIEVLEK